MFGFIFGLSSTYLPLLSAYYVFDENFYIFKKKKKNIHTCIW